MTGLWKCRGTGVEGVIGMVFATQVRLLIRVYVSAVANGGRSYALCAAARGRWSGSRARRPWCPIPASQTRDEDEDT